MKLPTFIWRKAKAVMEPNPRHLDRCNNLHDGKYYQLVQVRSPEEHKLFFAVAAEAFAQFPEEITGPIRESFETEENQRRKFRSESLCQCGFCTVQFQNWDDPDLALKAAAKLARYHPYSSVKFSGAIIKVMVPESMAIDNTGTAGGMTAARFRKAQNACFEYWAHTIGVSVEELVQNAKPGRHAA